MGKYKAKETFSTTGGKRYYRGDTIDQYDYDRLTKAEKLNFEKKSSSSDSDDDSLFGMGKPGSLAMGDMLGTGLPGGIDMDFTTPL